MKGKSNGGIGIALVGVLVISLPLTVETVAISFPLFSKVLLGIYGFCVMIGGVYRNSFLGSFTDISAVVGMSLIAAGPPSNYIMGYEAWSYLLIASTLLLAAPSAILAVYTHDN
jgi:hypothetical protein